MAAGSDLLSMGELTEQWYDRISEFIPVWLQPIVVLFIVPAALWLLRPELVVKAIGRGIKTLISRHQPVDKRRAERRARFAESIASQLAPVDQEEAWRHDRFTEMDAEIEFMAPQPGRYRSKRDVISRVPSLLAALESSGDRVIVLEGEPGSGKTVAMRRLAERLALRLASRPSETGVIPIYIDLKEFRAPLQVDSESVRQLVLESMNRGHDSYTQQFISDEFDRGREEGTWLFLFDSFDEIPAVLGSVEADEAINVYFSALHAFLTEMHRCRGIISTRVYRGPRGISGSRFNILPLSKEKSQELVRKQDLSPRSQRQLLSDLMVADPTVRQMADNPLLLALLCEHQRDGRPFPANAHQVFDDYTTERMTSAREVLRTRFRLEVDDVRTVAEYAAFCMGAVPRLGLNPPRLELLAAMSEAGLATNASARSALDALEHLRLARPSPRVDHEEAPFTFAHRRFQEYFATCLVTRLPDLVASRTLLTDGRWRETTIILLQSESPIVAPLLAEMDDMLAAMLADVGTGIGSEPGNQGSNVPEAAGDHPSPTAVPFEWPGGALHLLAILQSAFSWSDPRLPEDIRDKVGRLLQGAWRNGMLHDRRWAVEMCSIASSSVARSLLKSAFAARSAWLQEAAYSQAGRMTHVPPELRRDIWRALAGSAFTLWRWRPSQSDALIARLEDSGPERRLQQLFKLTPLIDLALIATMLTVVLLSYDPVAKDIDVVSMAAVVVILMHASFYADRLSRRLEPTSDIWRLHGLRLRKAPVRRHSDQPEGVAYAATTVRLIGLLCLVLLPALPSDLKIDPALDPSTLADDPEIFLTIARDYLRAIDFQMSLPVAALIVYLTAWTPVAVRADLVVRRPGWMEFVGLPVLGVVVVLRRTRTTLRQGLGSLTAGGVLLGVFAFAVTIGAFALLFWGTYTLFWLIPSSGRLAVILGGAVGLLLLGVIATNIPWWRDRWLLRSTHSLTAGAAFVDMLDALAAFRTSRGLAMFVQELKHRRLVQSDPRTASALRAYLAIASDRDVVDDEHSALHSRLKDQELAQLRAWLTSKKRGSEPFVVSEVVLDEVGKLVADADFVRLSGRPVPAADGSYEATR